MLNRQVRTSQAAIILTVGIWALAVGDAWAAESASIQTVLETNGGGQMVANSQTNPGDETWSWDSCTLALTVCRPFAQGRIVETAGAKAETVFRATSSRGATTLSPVWHGVVTPAAPPSIGGKVRAGELVVPIPGRWNGGWDGDVDWTQLAACATPHDDACTTLTDRHYVGGCPNGAAVLDPAFTGQYLRVADRRVPAHTLELAYGVLTPYGSDIWQAGPTVSVAFMGRIAPTISSDAADCGPAALVEASISGKGIATVRCELGCRAALIAKRGTLKARLTRKLDPDPSLPSRDHPAPILRLSPRSLVRLEPGRVRMTVRVNGRRVARRTVILR